MERFGPPKPPAWMSNMKQFIKPKVDRTNNVQFTNLKKRVPCTSEQCKTLSAANVDPVEKIGECKCSSTDWQNPTAKRCKLDSNGVETDECFNCPSTQATAVCGYWSPYQSQCSTTCGAGTRQVGSCYTFYEAARNDDSVLQCGV